MHRGAVIFMIGTFVLAGCSTLGDRILQVKVATISESGTPLRDCQLSLISGETDKIIEAKSNISPEFLNSFVSPPTQGTYYFKVTCARRTKEFRSSKFGFASGPYLHELGRVVIGP